MEEMIRIKQAADFIKEKIETLPEIALILGSGLGVLADEVENRIEIDYCNIPNFPISTVKGHEGRFVYGDLGGKKVIMMQGRFHFYEGYDMKTVVFPVRVLKTLGVDKLVVTNACGGVNLDFKPGDLMIITDHINMCGDNPLIGKNLDDLGPRFPDMSSPYNKDFIEIAKKAAKECEINIKSGVYMMMSGPCYETPAEIKMARIMGADAIGMSTVPEVICANHCGIKVLGISCITNMAAGILNQPLNHQEVIETSNRVKEGFKSLIREIVKNM